MGEPACYAHMLDEFGRIPDQGDVNVVRVADLDFAPAGRRVLIDRTWPPGTSGVDLGLDLWVPQLAPSGELEDWFAGDLARWPEFVRRYRSELEDEKVGTHLLLLQQFLLEGPLVLVHSADDGEHNAAVVLREFLSERQSRGAVQDA